MTKMAQVMAVAGGKATVSFNKHAACGDCGACQLGEENMTGDVEVVNLAGAAVGDYVELELADQDVLSAAFKLYMVPLIVMLMAIGLSQLLLRQLLSAQTAEAISAIFGFSAVAVVYIYIRKKYDNDRDKRRYQSVITRIVDQADFCEAKPQ